MAAEESDEQREARRLANLEAAADPYNEEFWEAKRAEFAVIRQAGHQDPETALKMLRTAGLDELADRYERELRDSRPRPG